jgi:arylsulfatase A-like enzyme
VVFTADNGGPVITGDAVGARNTPLRGGKHSIWEGGIHGTALISGPALPSTHVRFPSSGGLIIQVPQFDGLMHCVDWMPTLLDAIGASSPTGLDGTSQWAALTSGAQPPRSHVYTGLDDTLLCRGLRTDDWKLLVGVPFILSLSG